MASAVLFFTGRFLLLLIKVTFAIFDGNSFHFEKENYVAFVGGVAERR